MPLIKFTHGGKEISFSGDRATHDLANFITKENFGFDLVEMSQRLIGFIFEYDGIKCYFAPQMIVRNLAPAQVKADVQNLIEDFKAVTEAYGFDVCPKCNVVYPNTKVEHCKKCGYTPPELQEAKKKLMGLVQNQEETDGAEAGGGEPDGAGVQGEGGPPQGSDEASEIIPEPGSLPEQELGTHQPPSD